jgi:hypothetical protein
MLRTGQYVRVDKLYVSDTMMVPAKYTRTRRKGVRGIVLRHALWNDGLPVVYIQHLDEPKIVAAYFASELVEIPNPHV